MSEYISGFYISDALGSTVINGITPLNAWPVCVVDNQQVVMAIWKRGEWPTPGEGEVTEAIESLPEEVSAEIVARALGDIRDGVASTPQLYESWQPGIDVTVGQMLVHEIVTGSGEEQTREVKLYRVVQAHTTQSDWEPQIVPALFVVAVPPGVIPDWVQPAGAHDAYQLGDKVRFEGKIYESLINANVWSPSVYAQGWQEVAE